MFWVQKEFRDYYKPKLRRELKRDPRQEEMDARFGEIYSRVRLTLLVGVFEGSIIVFYEIAKYTLEEFERWKDRPEQFIYEQFGGGNFKLNFYEGDSFIVTVNFKPKGDPKWESLVPDVPLG